MHSTIEFVFSDEKIRCAGTSPRRRRAAGWEGRLLADDVEQSGPVAVAACLRFRGRAHGQGVAGSRLRETRGLLGTLDVAADPVERFRHPAQHRPDLVTGAPRCPCSAALARVHDQRAPHRATRVSPPGSTLIPPARSARTAADRRGGPRACRIAVIVGHEGRMPRERDHRLGDVVARVRTIRRRNPRARSRRRGRSASRSRRTRSQP